MTQGSSPPDRPRNPLAQSVEAPFHALHREMNRLFDDVFHGRLSGAGRQDAPISPITDVCANDRQVRVTIELPGIDSNDIDLSLAGDLLTVRAEKKADSVDPNDSYHIIERSYGTFQRTVRLPCAVVEDQSQARFDNGVLIVTFPRAGAQQTARKIPVAGGSK
ncbi:Hsp20/alpha crystallin family protein [Bosea sp. AS-1]|uniref:Hsp20/alpha crystallin family protein n=1 Tax=Bosea sp. AS-1 TaxID=2015316 RepID=UPI000B779477|nr:Hsp20/alpha crystallin family protein [Bosea sp. AS-1]